MASTLSSPKVALSISGTLSAGAAPAIASAAILHQAILSLTVGASAGQVNKAFSAPVSVTTGTPLVIDLTTAADPLGNVPAFTKVSTILFTGANGATQQFTVGGGTNPVIPAEAQAINAKDGVYLWHSADSPLTVDGTHKNVQITVAAGTAIAGQLTVIGQ
jgi:hypothetical protein